MLAVVVGGEPRGTYPEVPVPQCVTDPDCPRDPGEHPSCWWHEAQGADAGRPSPWAADLRSAPRAPFAEACKPAGALPAWSEVAAGLSR